MRRFLATLFATLALVGTAAAQTPPPTLPANTVWGRLGIGPGPGQAIPFNVLLTNVFANNSTGITVTGKGGFYTDMSPVGIITNLSDRLFVDDGRLYNGAYNGGNISTALTNTGIGADVNAASWGWPAIGASLYSLSSQSRIGVVGMATASVTPQAGTRLPIGGAFFGLENSGLSSGVEVWGTYTEAGLIGGGANIAVGQEIDIFNKNVNSLVGIFNMYGNGGLGSGYNTIGQQIAASGSYNPGGVFTFLNVSAAISINTAPQAAANTPAFDKGIVFAPAALDLTHPISTLGSQFGYAINQGTNASYVWWRNNSSVDQLAAFITQSDTTVGTTLGHNVYGLQFGNATGATTLFTETLLIRSSTSNTTNLDLGFGSTGNRQTNINFSSSTANSNQDATITRQSGQNGAFQFFNVGSGAIAFTLNGNQGVTWLDQTHMGFGTETNPQVQVVISQNVTTGLSASANALLSMIAADGVSTIQSLDSYGANANTVYRRADGTAASPTKVLANESLGALGARPYTGAGSFVAANTAVITFFAAEDQNDGTHLGTYITLNTTPLASNTRAETVRVQPDGGLSVGTATTNATSSGLGSVAMILHSTNKGATITATAPGAGSGALVFGCGTNAGTAGLYAGAGTSTTYTRVLDNIGAAVTGC